MIIACPKCKARHDVSARKPGETFACTCGNVIETPKKKGGAASIIVLVVIAACSVPCLGILAAIAIPNFVRYQLKSKASEARMNLMAIRTAELAYYGQFDTLVAAGPVPASIPKQLKQGFVPDAGFKTLGWTPMGPVYYQYEVKLTGPKTAILTAKGDIDGDGTVAEYQIALDAEGGRGDIKELNPGEF